MVFDTGKGKARMLGLVPLHPAPPVEVPSRQKAKPAPRMVALDDVIARLEQGFGKGCAPVTTLLHHFGQAEKAPVASETKQQN